MGRYKEPTVLLIQLNTGWLVRCTTQGYASQPTVTRYTFNKCAEAIEFIQILKLDLTNAGSAPLKPYRIVS